MGAVYSCLCGSPSHLKKKSKGEKSCLEKCVPCLRPCRQACGAVTKCVSASCAAVYWCCTPSQAKGPPQARGWCSRGKAKPQSKMNRPEAMYYDSDGVVRCGKEAADPAEEFRLVLEASHVGELAPEEGDLGVVLEGEDGQTREASASVTEAALEGNGLGGGPRHRAASMWKEAEEKEAMEKAAAESDGGSGSESEDEDEWQEVWYVIDAAWVRTWLTYAVVRRGTPRPCAIDNSTLVRVETDSGADGGVCHHVAEGLTLAGKRTGHYRHINEATWKVYSGLYECLGPVIEVMATCWVDRESGKILREFDEPAEWKVDGRKQRFFGAGQAGTHLSLRSAVHIVSLEIHAAGAKTFHSARAAKVGSPLPEQSEAVLVAPSPGSSPPASPSPAAAAAATASEDSADEPLSPPEKPLRAQVEVVALVPQGASVGDTLSVDVHGRPYEIQVPAGADPGDELHVVLDFGDSDSESSDGGEGSAADVGGVEVGVDEGQTDAAAGAPAGDETATGDGADDVDANAAAGDGDADGDADGDGDGDSDADEDRGGTMFENPMAVSARK